MRIGLFKTCKWGMGVLSLLLLSQDVFAVCRKMNATGFFDPGKSMDLEKEGECQLLCEEGNLTLLLKTVEEKKTVLSFSLKGFHKESDFYRNHVSNKVFELEAAGIPVHHNLSSSSADEISFEVPVWTSQFVTSAGFSTTLIRDGLHYNEQCALRLEQHFLKGPSQKFFKARKSSLREIWMEEPSPCEEGTGDRLQASIWQALLEGKLDFAKELESRLEQQLREPAVSEPKLLADTAMKPLLVHFPHGVTGVFKIELDSTADPEAHLLTDGEIVAYLLDQKLNINMVPVTIRRKLKILKETIPKRMLAKPRIFSEGDGHVEVQGSLQLYVYGYKDIRDFGKAVQTALEDTNQYHKMKLIDYLLANMDRHDRNWMYSHQTGRILVIDTGAVNSATNYGKGLNMDSGHLKELIENSPQVIDSVMKLNHAELKKLFGEYIREPELEEINARLIRLQDLIHTLHH